MAMHKVVWQEGMLLRPQHFQQNDRYYDYQLKTRTQKLDSYAWGFFELEIDRQFLNMGKLVVSKAKLLNYWDRSKPVPPQGPVELQFHGDPLWFKNIYIKELP